MGLACFKFHPLAGPGGRSVAVRNELKLALGEGGAGFSARARARQPYVDLCNATPALCLRSAYAWSHVYDTMRPHVVASPSEICRVLSRGPAA